MDAIQKNRRLAAILAADVVGYSRLMANDESGTLKALNRHREVDFNPNVSRHNGRIVKLMGDGTLVEFASVVDAVNCALAIQLAANAVADQSPKIVLRIGINLGDIVTQGDDIYGDGVNIAARLEQLAIPGGLCISSVVKESIGGRITEPFNDGGEVTVKNIQRPLRVFHWHPEKTTSGNRQPLSQAAEQTRPENPSIAVLPFDNMSGDAEQEYFSDGISEDIITDLSKVSGLLVIARNSSFAYKGKSTDLRLVGQQLGVSHVLEGSIRRAGKRVRITAQLIDASTGTHVWADRYDRELEDIFAVQDEVTLEIVNALKIHLSPAERANISSVGTTNLEAHENFMRMRGLLFHPGMDSQIWQQAVSHGEKAIEQDPKYAQAYAVLSLMHLLDYHNHWSGRDDEIAIRKAEELASLSLELGPDETWPNEAAAVVARWTGKLELADEMIAKVMARSPDNALGLFTSGEISMALGRLPESVTFLERAVRLDPAMRHQYLQFLAMSHFLMGNYETASLMFRERIILVKNTDVGRAWLASTLGHLGEVEAAKEIWAELSTINPNFSIETRLERLKFADPTYAERVLEGLAKAGLPE
jgi:adenylate cyclase